MIVAGVPGLKKFVYIPNELSYNQLARARQQTVVVSDFNLVGRRTFLDGCRSARSTAHFSINADTNEKSAPDETISSPCSMIRQFPSAERREIVT